MNEFRSFVDDIASTVAVLSPSDFVVNGRLLPLEIGIIHKLGLAARSKRFSEIVGDKQVEEFFRDYEPKAADSSIHLFKSFSQIIPACCSISADGHISLDAEQLFDSLSRIAECIQSGELAYSICLRVLNIDIANDFELGPGIRFRKLSREDIACKYPIDQNVMLTSQMIEENWLNHRVEVVIPGRGKLSELQQRLRIEETHSLINSILDPFIIANIPPKSSPCVTHFVVDAPIEGYRQLHGMSHITFNPPVLSSEEVTTLQKAYTFLANAQNDRVLQTAVDRFILGRKQDLHHQNRINEPNWDKIVDYVIALETLLLTVNGNAGEQELAYRFRLNGSLLLRKCTGCNVRQGFHALKHLYELRSKVVHGCDESAVLKAANKLISELQIDCPNHQHSLGRLMLVAKQVEAWLADLLFYIASISASERPFRKKDGWEEMVWHG